MRRDKFIFAVLLSIISLSVSAETLTLDSCLQLARANNAVIQKAEMEVERAKQVRMQALTKFFPQIQGTAVGYHSLKPIVDLGIDDISNASVRDLLLTLYGNYGAALGLENTLSLFQHGVSAGVSAIQPVFMGGKIVAGNRLAQLGVEAAELQSQIAERDLLEQVEESYWLVAGLREKQYTLAQVTLLLDTIQHIVETAVNVGLATETDLMQVQVKQAELQRQHIRLESGLQLATLALCQSIGIDHLDSLSSQPLSLMDDELTIPQYVTGSPIEASLLQLQTRASHLQRTMAIADALPKVAVGANYGYSNLDANILRRGLGGWNGAVFVTVSVPITGWWENAHKIKEQSILLDEARLQERDLTEKLALRTQQTYNQLIEAKMLIESCERSLHLAQNRQRLMLVSYQNGSATISELLQTETELLNAQNEVTDAHIAYRVQAHRLQDLMEK